MAQTGKVPAGLQLFNPPPAGGNQPGGPLGGPVSFTFNPNELSLRKSANWIPHVARSAQDVGVAEFSGSGPRELSLTVFLDATDTHDRSVQERVEKLLTTCVPTKASIAAKAPSPPWVKFVWGQFQTVSFYSYVSSVDATYKLFDPDGTPLRATCAMTLTEISGSTPGQNPTSGSLSAQRVHRLVAGDTLEMLAYREYGSPTEWRVIAEANDIDDPVRLRPGRQLLIPAVDGVAGLGGEG